MWKSFSSVCLLVHGILQARILEWVAIPSSRGSSQPRDRTQFSNPVLPHCRLILKPAEPQGKPKKTGVGSLSLLQQTFPTWEFDWGLLHCRWILYQLRYQRSLYLQYLFSKCDSAFKGISIMWRLVRNAGSQAPRMVISTFNRDCPGLPRTERFTGH